MVLWRYTQTIRLHARTVAQIIHKQVVNPRAALLSNFEVLSLLKDLEADHLARSKALQKLKKDDELAGRTTIPGNTGSVVETSENLRTIEVEVRHSFIAFSTLCV